VPGARQGELPVAAQFLRRTIACWCVLRPWRQTCLNLIPQGAHDRSIREFAMTIFSQT
jgi:hypothetical protein